MDDGPSRSAVLDNASLSTADIPQKHNSTQPTVNVTARTVFCRPDCRVMEV